MRLLDTHTLQLELFEGGSKATYAILSHTWGAGEVTFQDLGCPHAAGMAGWSKIAGAARAARREGYRYIWIDTCCIDKTSSAELSEAINSMWQWYADAEVCYAYLVDVPSEGFDAVGADLYTPLEKARWFTRGWTLQELLAPAEVLFFAQDWREIGTKESLKVSIAEITGIDTGVLQMQRKISSCSIAQRMSWAAHRRSTRLEDEAYCLMGLFDVNIPLLYGEGQKAFRRLQLAIMTETHDPTILAWGSVDSSISVTGILAPSPEAFEGCRDIAWNRLKRQLSARNPLTGDPKVGHEIIGSSLKLDAALMAVDMMSLNLEAFSDSTGGPQPASGLGLSSPGILFQNIMHYPRDGPNARQVKAQFDYSFLHSKGHDVSMVILHGCEKGGKYTIGITVCSHQDGSLRRLHYPTRFLLPQDWSWTPRAEEKTLYLALHGWEVLRHSKPIFTLERCLVRITEASDGLPYELSHTLPPKTPDATNCWYADRWSDVTDRATMTPQPGFALRGPGSGCALVFRHTSDLGRSFVLIFTLWRFPGIGNRFLVSFQQGEDAMTKTRQDELKPMLPDPSQGPQFEARFPLDSDWTLSVKLRKPSDVGLAILSFSSALHPG